MSEASSNPITAAVTGATGFIAQQLISDLLTAGHRVRGSLRSETKAPALKDALAATPYAPEQLQLQVADLESEEGWSELLEGCQVLYHLASPLPLRVPKDPQKLIVPAREGTLRLLRAATQCGVSRVVLTSSCAAIAYGWTGQPPQPFSEEHWSKADNCAPYPASKTLAEQSAWQYVRDVDPKIQLSTINPSVVLGPQLSPKLKTSVSLIARLLDGSLPALPRCGIQIVDVRDVSAAHIRVGADERCHGERYILADRFMWLHEIADLLREYYPEYRKKIPTRVLPDLLVRSVSVFSRDLRALIPELGRRREASSKKIREFFGHELISAEESIVATVESLKKFGHI